MTNPIDPATFQAFLQFQAQQAAAQAQQYAPPTIAPPVAPQVPVQPTVPVSTEDAMDAANRPKGYGPSLFKTGTDQPGLTFAFTVAGPTGAKQPTNYKTKQPEFYPDGRPKIELLIPLDVAVSERHPEGRATLYSKGALTDELSRVMSAAGVPQEVLRKGLEPGATGTITYQGKVTRQSKDGDTYTANAYAVTYNRPGSAAPTVATTNYAEQAQAQPVQVPAQPPAPAPATPALPAVPGLDAKQAEILAQLQAMAAGK